MPGLATAQDARPRSCISLARYAQKIGYNERSFFGVVEEVNKYRLWEPNERDYVADYLSEAQAEIEQIVRYPLCPTWFEDEDHPYQVPVPTNWMKVLELGVRAIDPFGAGAVVNYATEPATIGPIVTALTDTSEIGVYYPSSDREIAPDTIVITGGGQLTIRVPRARLVDPDYFYDQGAGYDYNDPTLFTTTVDVVRVYNDPSDQATLVWSHGNSLCPACASADSTACMTLVDAEIGRVDVLPAAYSAGAWSVSSWDCFCHYPDRVQLNYSAGLSEISLRAEDAVMRLAHAKMPSDPCNVDPPNWWWARDKNIPRALTKERLNCPFGLSDGAWTAYRFARGMKRIRGYTL